LWYHFKWIEMSSDITQGEPRIKSNNWQSRFSWITE
jgi:hypothetical protein